MVNIKLNHIYCIGIDPDTNKSGVGCWSRIGKPILTTMGFFELFDFLKENKDCIHCVIIEAGWLNKSTWHGIGKGSFVVAKIGKNVGANHETGKKIIELCKYLNIRYTLSRPAKTKLNAKKFKSITGITETTNPEKRDAFMLAFGYIL